MKTLIKAETCSLCRKAMATCTCDDPIEYALVREHSEEPPITITATAQELLALRALVAEALRQLCLLDTQEEMPSEVLNATELLEFVLYGDMCHELCRQGGNGE